MLSHRPRTATAGFTLIELLVVIAIIATLMGLLIPAVTIVKNRAKRAKTQTFLMQIEAALKSYRDVNGVYPESNRGSSDPADQMTSTGYNDNAEWLHAAVLSVDRETFRAGDLKDPYKNLVHYRPAKALPFLPVTNSSVHPYYPGHIDGEQPPGADSYQLWSVGGNGSDEVTLSTIDGEYGDDIVTWK